MENFHFLPLLLSLLVLVYFVVMTIEQYFWIAVLQGGLGSLLGMDGG